MNNCTFTGNLVRDPKLNTVKTDDGDKEVCNFTFANNEGWGDKKTTTYIDASVWGGAAAACKTHLVKGSKVAACGSISLRKWETQDGEPRSVISLDANRVDFLSGKPKPEASESTESDDIPF